MLINGMNKEIEWKMVKNNIWNGRQRQEAFGGQLQNNEYKYNYKANEKRIKSQSPGPSIVTYGQDSSLEGEKIK